MSTIYRIADTFYYSYVRNGKRYKKTLKTKDRTIAKIVQAQYDLDLEKDAHGLRSEREALEYLNWYKDHHLVHLKPLTARIDHRRILNFIESSKVEKLSHITPPVVHTYLLSKKDISPKTWNLLRGVIRTWLGKAVPRHLKENPVDSVPMKKEPKHSIDFFTEEEYAKIEKAAKAYPDKKFREMINIAFWTGLRIGEILHLEAEDFQFEGRPLIHVRNKPHLGWTVKNYQTRAIPLSADAVAKLGHLKAKKGLLFPSITGEPYKHLHGVFINDILKKAGVKRSKRAWHLFRHTFASRCVKAGVPLGHVRQWLGHGSFANTLRYAHLAPDYSPEIEKINLPTATKSATRRS